MTSRIAKANSTNTAAVIIVWLFQKDVVAVTTKTKPERLDEYAQALSIKLAQEELDGISNLPLSRILDR